MSEEVYKELAAVMGKRGGGVPGMDIPEFYPLAEELFTPAEAEVNNALPRGYVTAKDLAEALGKDEKEVWEVLDGMAGKGLVTGVNRDGADVFQGLVFVPGIFEFKLAAGGTTDQDKKIARLIHNYEEAVRAVRPLPKAIFATSRVIPVEKTIEAGQQVNTYNQVKAIIDEHDKISVMTCYCRHQAFLLDESSDKGYPNDVCMSFGDNAESLSNKGLAKLVDKTEAMRLLDLSEEAGLVHMSRNTQSVTFICNCDRYYCMSLTSTLKQEKPGLYFNSGYLPIFDADSCTACETCLDRCPAAALVMGDEDIPVVDLDRCFGCSACATGCPSDTITMEAKPGFPEVPADGRALGTAVKAKIAELST